MYASHDAKLLHLWQRFYVLFLIFSNELYTIYLVKKKKTR